MTNDTTTNHPLDTIEKIKAANAAAGYYFFSKDTMRFFASRVLSTVFPIEDGSALFITSEKSGFDDPTRQFTVRRAMVGGDIDSVSEFGQFATARAAIVAARRKAAELDGRG